jgi:hypothetical protein
MAKNIKADQFETPNGRGVMELSVDPTAGGGVAAEIGTIGLRNNSGVGEEWLKTGAADTAWTLQGSGIGAHALGGAEHTADSLANLNSKLTDAVLDDEDNPRPADEIIETSGPTTMAVGAVADGEYLKRSGATVVGGTPPGGTTAEALGTTGADVDVGSAAPPSTGQVLKATSATTATWQDDSTTDANAIHKNVASEISTVTEKGTPVAADLLLIEDSADSNNKKRVQVGNLPGGGGGAGASVAAGGDYIQAGMSAAQVAPSVDDPVDFDTVESSRGNGELSLDTGTGRFSGLKAGRTYLLSSSIRAGYTTWPCSVWVRWYDVTAASYVGTRCCAVTPTYTTNDSAIYPATYVFTPSVDTEVEVRVVAIDPSGAEIKSDSFAAIYEIGAVQANVIGGLEYMDRVEVSADTNSVTFGASGDGELQRALDGDVDGVYFIKYYVKHTADDDICLRPNGASTNQTSQRTTLESSRGTHSDRLVLLEGGSTMPWYGEGYCYLDARTSIGGVARARTYHAWQYFEGSAAQLYGRMVSGKWNETSTNITSLEIATFAGNNYIGAGSVFELYRLTNNNARADNASIYERNVEATVAQGTNSEVEYTTGHATYQGCAIGLSASLNDTVTAGSITVNLKVGGSTVLTVTLSSGSFDRAIAALGTHPISPGDEIEVGIATTSLVTTGGGTPGITVNVMLLTDAFFQPAVSRGVESNSWSSPDNPSSDDDEFESTVLDSAWTVYPTRSSLAIDPYASFSSGGPRLELHTERRRSWLMIQPDQGVCRIDKPYTLPTNVLIWARMSFNLPFAEPTNNCANITIGFSDGLGGSEQDNIRIFLNEADSTVTQADFSKTEGGSTSSINTSDNVSREGQALAYAALHKIGTTFHAWVGTENGSWLYLGSTTHANLGNLDNIQISANNVSSTPGNPILGVDFIRIVESATFLP